jgi:hypothetical protein
MNCRRKVVSVLFCMYQYTSVMHHTTDCGFSSQRPRLILKLLHVRFVLNVVTRIKIPSQFLLVSPYQSPFHHCSIASPPDLWDNPYQAALYHVLGQ